MIEILKNVPIPAKKRRGSRRENQDLHDLVATWEVGDCVVLELDSKSKAGQPFSRRETVLRAAAERSNQKVTRRASEDGKSISVWRIE